MVRRTIFLGVLLIPMLASAEQLELTLGGSVEYDSNVFRSPRVEEQDAVFRVLPRASLVRSEGDLLYRLTYELPFEQSTRFGGNISDVDQLLTLDSSWIYDEANEFTLSNRFRFDRSVTRRFADGDDVADVNSRRDRVLTNTASLGWNHAFSARTSGNLNFSHSVFDTEQISRQNNHTYAVSTGLNHSLSPRNQVGTGVSFTAQDFQAGGGSPDSQTFYYNLFGSWVHRFDETTTFSISGGPTLVQLEEQTSPGQAAVQIDPTVRGVPFDATTCGGTTLDTCSLFQGPFPLPAFGTQVAEYAGGVGPPGQSDLRITAFGRASLQKRWTPDLRSSVSYRRQQSTASGLGGSTILDALTARTEWEIDRWWSLALRGDFSLRESVGDSTRTLVVVQDRGDGVARTVPVGSGTGLVATVVKTAIDTQNYGGSGRLARRIGERAEASLRVSYNRQESKNNTLGRNSDYDVILAIFGVSYRFEPISLW